MSLFFPSLGVCLCVFFYLLHTPHKELVSTLSRFWIWTESKTGLMIEVYMYIYVHTDIHVQVYRI